MSEPILVRKGNATVKIYATRNGGYAEYKVVDYSNGRRRLHSFADEGEAGRKAVEVALALTRGEANVLTLRSKDRSAYLRAVDLLKPSGTALEVAAMHYAEAVKVLGSDRVLAAAQYFAKRHPRPLPAKLVQDVVAELIDDRTARKKAFPISPT